MLLKPHEQKADREFANDGVWTIVFPRVLTNNHFSITYCSPWFPVQPSALESELEEAVDVATKLSTLWSHVPLSTTWIMDLVTFWEYPSVGLETAFDLEAFQQPYPTCWELEMCSLEENKGQPISVFKILKSKRLLQLGSMSAFLLWCNTVKQHSRKVWGFTHNNTHQQKWTLCRNSQQVQQIPSPVSGMHQRLIQTSLSPTNTS